MNGIALFDIELRHTSGKFAGYAYGGTFHLTFDIAVGAVHEHEADYCYHEYGQYYYAHGEQKCSVGTFLCVVVCIGRHLSMLIR